MPRKVKHFGQIMPAGCSGGHGSHSGHGSSSSSHCAAVPAPIVLPPAGGGTV
jgi:hypothetical protein